MLIRPRLGQSSFNLAVRDTYANACAVTGEHSLPTLEAAHIKPYARGGEHAVSNGLTLRRDVHALFDLGYVTVKPDFTFSVSRRLALEWHNGRTYYDLAGATLKLPRHAEQQPSVERLVWHNDVVFRAS